MVCQRCKKEERGGPRSHLQSERQSKKTVTPGEIHQETGNPAILSMKTNKVVKHGLSCLYSNVDQLLNKMDDLKTLIGSCEPDIMMFTEVIPKAQQKPIAEAQLKINGYELYKNFDHSKMPTSNHSLKPSRVSIYTSTYTSLQGAEKVTTPGLIDDKRGGIY